MEGGVTFIFPISNAKKIFPLYATNGAGRANLRNWQTITHAIPNASPSASHNKKRAAI